MRQKSTGPATFANSPQPIGDGAEAYAAAATAYIGARGGQGFVIVGPDGSSSKRKEFPPTPAQWNAWMAWLASKAIPTVFARSHGVVTVPCEWPEDFDMSAPISDRHYRFSEPEPRRNYGAEIARLGRREFMNNMRAAYPGVFRKEEVKAAVPAEAKLAALSEKFATAPPIVSDSLRLSNQARTEEIKQAKGEVA